MGEHKGTGRPGGGRWKLPVYHQAGEEDIGMKSSYTQDRCWPTKIDLRMQEIGHRIGGYNPLPFERSSHIGFQRELINVTIFKGGHYEFVSIR